MQSFDTYGLNSSILKAVTDLGYTEPTSIQSQVIPFLLSSDGDMVGLAQTGTGKTAAFGLPILNKIDTRRNTVACLILSPTRELCVQIFKDLKAYAKYLPAAKITAVYGGVSVEPQIKDLKQGSHIVVGTPGRVLDLIQRNVLKINDLQILILDEADEMLNMGFKEDLDKILRQAPSERRTLLFSATMPDEIGRIAANYMRSPKEISVGRKNAGADNVEHFYYMVNAKNRYLALKRIADDNPEIYGIVFCRTRKETQDVADKLIEDGYNADALHGDLSQAQRDHVMQKFRHRLLHLLVATDVAARGLDVDNLTHIINYNIPDEREVYIHRTGRTGRAGKKGIAISIIHSREIHKIKDIEKILNKKIQHKLVPSGKDICNKQLLAMIDKIINMQTIDNQIDSFLPVIFEKLAPFDRDELIKRFVSVEFNRFLSYYKNADDINVYDKKCAKTPATSKPESRLTFATFFLNIGSKDGLDKRVLLNMINNSDRLANAEIGRIDVQIGYTLFEADARLQNEVIKTFHNKRFAGKRLKIEIKESTQRPTHRRRS